MIAPATSQDLFNQTVHQSPSAWIQGLGALTVGWTQYSDGTSVTNYITPGLNLDLSTSPYIVVTEATPIYSGPVRASLPSEWRKIILENLTTIPGTNDSITSCSGNWDMSGEPTAHIPVNELTIFASNTFTSDGVYGGSSAPVTTSATEEKSDEGETSPVESKTQPKATDNSRTSSPDNNDEPTPVSTNAPVTPTARPETTATLSPDHDQPPASDESDEPTPDTTKAPDSSRLESDISPTNSHVDDGPSSEENGDTEQDETRTTASHADGAGPSSVNDSNRASESANDEPGDNEDRTSEGASEATSLPLAIPTKSQQSDEEKSSDNTDSQGDRGSNSDESDQPGQDTGSSGGSGKEGSTMRSDGPPSETAVDESRTGTIGSQLPSSEPTSGAGSDDQVSPVGQSQQDNGASNGPTNDNPSTNPADSDEQTPAPFIVIGSSTFTQNSASAFVIDDDKTLSADGPAVTTGNDVVSLAPSGVFVVNGQSSLVATPVDVRISIGVDASATPLSGGTFLLPDDVVLSEGSSSVVGDNTFVAGPSGILSVSGESVNSPPATIAAIVPGVTLQTATRLVIKGSTILPGSSAIVSGTTYALPSAGSSIIINGEAMALPSANAESLLDIDGVFATPTELPQYVFSETTLFPGSAVTIDGTTYSVPSTGSDIVVNGATITGPVSDLQIGSSAITATPTQVDGNEAYELAGQALTSGGKITIDDRILSIAPSGGAIVAVSDEDHTENIADEIMNGIGGGNHVSSTTQDASSGPTAAPEADGGADEAVEESTGGADRMLVGCGAGFTGLIMLAFWL